MEKLLFTDKEYIEIPETIDEVTFRQFIGIADCDNLNLQAISILTNVSREEWAVSTNTSLYYYIFNKLSSWLLKELNELGNKEINRLSYYSKNIEVTDLGDLSVAQFEDLKILFTKYQELYLTEPIKAMREYMPIMVAIYLQPLATGEDYNYEKCKAITDQVNELPAPTVIGLVNFFLVKFAVSASGMKANAQKPVTWWRKPMQVLSNYLTRLAFSQRLTRWQAVTFKRKTI